MSDCQHFQTEDHYEDWGRWQICLGCGADLPFDWHDMDEAEKAKYLAGSRGEEA